MKSEITKEGLLGALKSVGITKGETVFFHISLDKLGSLTPGTDQNPMEALFECLRDSVGETGTVLVPAYTFSFFRRESFDIANSPAHGGLWSTSSDFLEFFRERKDTVRSRDPILSVAGIGPNALELLSDVPNTCFGEGSIFQRLKDCGARICVIGGGLQCATFTRYVEEFAGVPFRFKKLFSGHIRHGSSNIKTGWIYNARILSKNARPNGERLDSLCRLSGKCRSMRIGNGEVVSSLRLTLKASSPLRSIMIRGSRRQDRQRTL